MNVKSDRVGLLKIFFIVTTGLILVLWLVKTPPGIYEKAEAIGFAVCHQIPERSFLIGERPLPLCARCTGMYLGALTGLLYQLRTGKRGGMPARKISMILGLFFLVWVVDGVNSYLQLFPASPKLYTPQNWLRLVTGSGMGIGMAAMLYPVFNQSIWFNWNEEATLQSWRQLCELIILVIIIDLCVLLQNPIVLYPVVFLSSASVLVLLTMIYTIVWTMLLKQENHFYKINEIWWLLVAGFGTAMVQIYVLDIGRYSMTGTWDGFFLK